MRVQKIISGGQTGVDRGALDAAIRAGLTHGGWCPRGRRAEDGRIPDRYSLTETNSYQYRLRTERNILDSDGTLIIARGLIRGGTRVTARLAALHGKPSMTVNLRDATDINGVRQWIEESQIHVLNVAGPRESQNPGIAGEAGAFLDALLTFNDS